MLSEGQNLQDGAIVVNYDLPWAIIRLAQRAGRVDRIGQTASRILCYSFLPADGVERVLQLRKRVRDRLRENAEVVGTDEAYFEDDEDRPIIDLYNEKTGILDGEDDDEIDLGSYAYQIWKNATDDQPRPPPPNRASSPTSSTPPASNPVRHSRESGNPSAPTPNPPGVLVSTSAPPSDNDTLIRLDAHGNTVSQSHFATPQRRPLRPRRAGRRPASPVTTIS